MGSSSSTPKFVAPVTYSAYNEDVDGELQIEEDLKKLRCKRLTSMMTCLLGTLFTLMAIVSPCWISSIKRGVTIGLFHECDHGNCRFVRGQEVRQCLAALTALIATCGQVVSLCLHGRTLTRHAIVGWNCASFISCTAGLMITTAAVDATRLTFRVIGYSEFFYGMSYFAAWIGAILLFSTAGVQFYLSHKFVWVLYCRPQDVRDFSMENSSDHSKTFHLRPQHGPN